MAILPLLDEQDRPELAELARTIRQQRQGRLPPLYALLLNSPALAQGWLGFFTALRQRSRLPDRLRELAILRVTQQSAARHEFRSHVRFALAAGITQRQIDELGDGCLASDLASLDRLCLSYADRLLANDCDPAWAAAELLPHFSDAEVLELTTTVAAYRMVATVSRSLGLADTFRG